MCVQCDPRRVLEAASPPLLPTLDAATSRASRSAPLRGAPGLATYRGTMSCIFDETGVKPNRSDREARA